MADFYIDLDQGFGAGGHAGTEGDPWDGTDFLNAEDGSHGSDFFYLKGEIDWNGNALAGWGSGIELNSWNKSINGPYRIVNPGTIEEQWHDGFFYSSGTISFGAINLFFDCMFISENEVVVIDNGGSFYGCIFRSYLPTYIDFATLQDSVIIGPADITQTPTKPFTAINCVFTDTQENWDPSTIDTFTNCQFGWTAPTLPAYNASRFNWTSTILAVGITTPPEPGIPPYSDYTTDPWGTLRTGIGAFYFGGLPPVIITQPIAQIKSIGQTASFSIDATGTSPLLYQWKKNDATILDATLSSYSISSLTQTDQGYYKIDVSNGYGMVTSSTVYLNVLLETASLSGYRYREPVNYNVGRYYASMEAPTNPGKYEIRWRYQKDESSYAQEIKQEFTVKSYGLVST